MKKLLKILSSRIVILGFLMLVQLFILGITIWGLSNYSVYLTSFFTFLSVIVVIYIVSRYDNPSFKLAWVITVLLFPVFGGLFYLLFGGNKMRKSLKNIIGKSFEETKEYLKQDEKVLKDIEKTNKSVYFMAKYIKDFSSYPIHKNTLSKYFSPGEKFYDELIKKLKSAKKFIFMEYFIVHEGIMWDTILEILVSKAKEGLDIRIIYDDVGCINTLPPKYNKMLESLNIKCVIFNPFIPILSSVVNNRDHRKITIIDGNIAFTGGINLADEYINKVVRFGYWKDSAIMIEGEAVWNFTIMFLQVWSAIAHEEIDYLKYKPEKRFYEKAEGYVQPYGDSPYDGELVGENVYLNIINKAKEYVYICTPYLIIDNELVTALTLAAKGGVDVRIITPHIEDKKYIHMVTRSYYYQLINSGIKIYEYTPGFIHSKIFVSDDEVATVGTINLDYRSLYLHFECGVFLFKTNTVFEIKKDFLETLKKCKQIENEDCKKVKWHTRITRAILKVFSPLM